MHGGYLNTILRQGLNTRIVKVPPDNTLLPEVKIFNSALPIPQSDENYQDLQNNNVIKEEDDGVLEHVINKQIIAPKINLSDEISEISRQEKPPDALISFQTRNEFGAKSNLEDIVRQDSEIVSESADKKMV